MTQSKLIRESQGKKVSMFGTWALIKKVDLKKYVKGDYSTSCQQNVPWSEYLINPDLFKGALIRGIQLTLTKRKRQLHNG